MNLIERPLASLAILLAGLVTFAGFPACVRSQDAPLSASLAKALEPLPPATYLARHDAVPVRSDPGFVYREIARLALGDKVQIDGRQGQWLRVRGGGWVFEDHVWTEADAAAAPPVASRLVVLRDGARVRESASTEAAVIDTLKSDAVLEAVGLKEGWWQLSSGGFISESLVRPQGTTPLSEAAAKASQPDRPLPWVVAAESANVRSGRGAEFSVVRRLVRGDIVTVTSVVDGWAEVAGGWVRQDLLEPPAPPKTAATRKGQGQAAHEPRSWSFMDLTGIIIEVHEFRDPEIPEGIRAEMRATGLLESDWTMLGIAIGVPADFNKYFAYSPKWNATRVKDAQGQTYSNVYAKGPLDRLPAHVRMLLDAQDIGPGQRFNGVLMFRPTLKVEDIREISFALNGTPHRLIPAR